MVAEKQKEALPNDKEVDLVPPILFGIDAILITVYTVFDCVSDARLYASVYLFVDLRFLDLVESEQRKQSLKSKMVRSGEDLK